MDNVLPVDGQGEGNRKPWLLYELPVNTLNFCSFGMCVAQNLSGKEVKDEEISDGKQLEKTGREDVEDLLIAVPNTLISEAVDIFHLPSCSRLMTVPGPKEDGKAINTGMVMALSILYLPSSTTASQPSQPPRLTLITGYESGHTSIMQVQPTLGWTPLYLAHPSKQPILSLSVDPSPEKAYYLTSGADAVIAKHPLSSLSPTLPSQSATSSLTSPNPPTRGTTHLPSTAPSKPHSLLSAALKSSSSPPSSQPQPHPKISIPTLHTAPLKLTNTHHSGQQSIALRLDGKIFATAGWDGRARVYSAKTLKEVAVLKWHKEGVYAVGFADVLEDNKEGGERDEGKGGEGEEGEGQEITRKTGALTVAQKRIKEATRTHWIAVGGKDGKVSLWDIY